MLTFIRERFAAKLIVLIGLTFLIPVVTSITTTIVTSDASLEWFEKELSSETRFTEELPILKKTLAQYEKGRTTTLVITLVVVSFVFAGVIILLSMLMLKRAMASLAGLSKAAEHVGKRHFDLSLTSHSRDEFGKLSHAMQQMADHLKETTVAKELAEESSRLRSEFLANMSHEIRTPLNGILGLAQTLADEEKDAERKQHLQTIDQCGRNLLNLINEILELSKIEAGQMRLHLEELDPKEVMHQAMETVAPICRKKGLELSKSIDPSTPVHIRADRRKLTQVLINLLGNAAKFTEHGSIHISAAPSQRNGKILFSVKDTGRGIEPERLPFIFESFVQGDDYLSRSSEGTGLGLTISKKLIEMMGGEIWVKSEQHRGTIFSFTIDGGV